MKKNYVTKEQIIQLKNEEFYFHILESIEYYKYNDNYGDLSEFIFEQLCKLYGILFQVINGEEKLGCPYYNEYGDLIQNEEENISSNVIEFQAKWGDYLITPNNLIDNNNLISVEVKHSKQWTRKEVRGFIKPLIPNEYCTLALELSFWKTNKKGEVIHKNGNRIPFNGIKVVKDHNYGYLYEKEYCSKLVAYNSKYKMLFIIEDFQALRTNLMNNFVNEQMEINVEAIENFNEAFVNEGIKGLSYVPNVKDKNSSKKVTDNLFLALEPNVIKALGSELSVIQFIFPLEP